MTRNRATNILISIAIFLVLYGCARAGKAFLVPDGGRLTGQYHMDGTEEAVFKNDSLRVTVRRIKPSDSEGSTLIKNLSDKKYIILKVGIENNSKFSVIYNPSLTALTDDGLDFLRPLDYTDLYDLTVADSGLESGLEDMTGKFYDIVLTLQPGEKSTRLIIFEPLSKNTSSAELDMEEIYIGTRTINLRFPFVLKTGKI